jgi:hypothetical protein
MFPAPPLVESQFSYTDPVPKPLFKGEEGTGRGKEGNREDEERDKGSYFILDRGLTTYNILSRMLQPLLLVVDRIQGVNH